jgi:hypothetical protein
MRRCGVPCLVFVRVPGAGAHRVIVRCRAVLPFFAFYSINEAISIYLVIQRCIHCVPDATLEASYHPYVRPPLLACRHLRETLAVEDGVVEISSESTCTVVLTLKREKNTERQNAQDPKTAPRRM